MPKKFRRTSWQAAVVTALAVLTVAPVSADPGFYQRPDPLPAGHPGDIIRTEPMASILSLPTPAGAVPGDATRIMFHSNDINGADVASTATVLAPAAPWQGPGPQPLVTYLNGTHGLGADCAASVQLSALVDYDPPLGIMAEYELPFLFALLAQGYSVVVVDYPGTGLPGPASFLNPIAEARAAIDATRAAQRLGNPLIPADGPVLFAGYSQGGNASGGVAEQLADYGPELDVKGIAVGAPAVDVLSLLDHADGTLLTGIAGYVLNALEGQYPDIAGELASIVNPAGRAMMRATAGQCAGETTLRYGLHRTGEWTTTGESLPAALRANPGIAAVVAELALGQRAPSVPVMMVTGDNDDIVPAAAVRDLAARWCAQGARVALLDTGLPTVAPGSILGHGANLLATFFSHTMPWFRDRLAGEPAPVTCR
ncbi:alpha/beta fold hydrolase [Nocardia brasiliensis]